MDPWIEVKKQAAKVLKDATGLEALKTLQDPKSEFGEVSSIICFTLAKIKKQKPVEIAKELVKKIDLSGTIFEKVEAVGPYINFKIEWGEFAKYVISETLRSKKDYGKDDYFVGKVLLEFPSVNPNKPWHIGHARNAVLGDTLARLMKTVGFKVTSMDYINDLGLQIAKTYWYVQNETPEGKFDQWLGKMYVEAEKQIEDNPELEAEVRDLLKQMEKSAIARTMCENCVKAQYETAFRMGISHDILVWETDIMKFNVFEQGLEKMIGCEHIRKLEEGDKAGCITADLSSFGEMKDLLDTEKVLVRSDGTPTYTGKDVAFHMWKVGLLPMRFKFSKFVKEQNNNIVWTTSANGDEMDVFEPADVIVNVIGAEQAQPQRLVYLTLRSMGYKNWDKMFHLSYQHVRMPEGKMSGRRGTGVSTDEVLDESVRRAKSEIEKKNPTLKEKEKTAEGIGVGAVRFVLLKTAPEKNIIFEWDKALSFEGESGPYCQYAHARACRILEKAEVPKKAEFSQLTGKEKKLILLLARYPDLLKKIVLGMKQEVWGTSLGIHLLPEYACKLASAFNQFYSESPILKAEPRLREARLQLVGAFKQVMSNVLTIIGIEALEAM